MPNTIALLDKIKSNQANINDTVAKKLQNNAALTDEEMRAYTLADEEQELLKVFGRVLDGETVPGFEINDFLATPQAKVLIPRVLIGAARKAADPVYLASKFYTKIKMKSGVAMQFPQFGAMRAYDVAEGQEIPQETITWNLHSNDLIHIGKCGLRIQYSKEVLDESEFDIVGMMVAEAGRAMARHSEQKAFREWQKHSWVVFDNNLASSDPDKYKEAQTTGVDFTNNLNNTMSIEDYLDLIIAVYNNGYVPTDTIIHPLAWTSFIKNDFTGALSATFDREAKRAGTGSVQLGPGAMNGKLPFGLTVNLSPFAPFNRQSKTFDMFVVDKNNVGVKIVKTELQTEEFRDPARDIFNLKFVERYGYGTHDEGRAVCSARNISMAKSYPTPERSIIIQ